MDIEIDRDRCIGAGVCVDNAPDVFGQDDDGIVELLTDRPAEPSRDAVDAAIGGCPTACLSRRRPPEPG
jgi:ferredoxin